MRLPRRRRGQRNSASADVIAAVRQLALIANDDLIAGVLNRNGLKTGNGNRWTRERVIRFPNYHFGWVGLGHQWKLVPVRKFWLSSSAQRRVIVSSRSASVAK